MNITGVIFKYREWLLVSLIIFLALYLRFWHIDEVISFDWDLGRDAWIVRDILNGQFVLKGPRTGAGDFYLGPAYYYLLAPFYFISNLDPSGAHYLNFVINVFTLLLMYWVTGKIFSKKTATIALLIYSFSAHTISTSMVPWNVALVPALSLSLIYSLYQILQGKYKYLAAVATLAGFFFHIHFTAIFVPVITLPYFATSFLKNKAQFLKWSVISLPLFAVWFIPTIAESFSNYHDNFYRFLNFNKTFVMAPHLRFMLFRLQDAFIQIAAIFHFKALQILKYVIPLIFIIWVLIKEKQRYKKLSSVFLVAWFVIPLFGFTLYKGHVADYYYLINLPVAVMIISYLLEKILNIDILVVKILVYCSIIFYLLTNTQKFWTKPSSGGLYSQKQNVLNTIENGGKFEYKEGDIKSYLYTIWVKDKKVPQF